MKQLLATTALLLATIPAIAPRAEAQCAPPDGLDNLACCSPAQLQIPNAKFKQDSLGICWQNCNVDAIKDYTAIWSGMYPGLWSDPTPPCGWFTARLRLVSGGALQWSGAIRLSYARTWVESDATGAVTHVWRFLANGDMRPTAAAGAPPCPVPSCVTAFGQARFTGYVDYAYDCATNTWQNAWMLTHGCDSIDHVPGFPRAGAFHPGRSYTFVGPSLGFAPSALLPVEVGGSGVESLRQWRIPPPGAVGPVMCVSEERVFNASVQPINTLCECSTAAGGQYMRGDLFASAGCGTTVQSLPGRYLSMAIGSWTDPSIYPGVESLRWNSGEHVWNDGCTGVATTEFFFGVTTLGGNPANQYLQTGIGAPLPLTFIDQASAKRLPTGTTVRNIPFLSDHMINLNF